MNKKFTRVFNFKMGKFVDTFFRKFQDKNRLGEALANFTVKKGYGDGVRFIKFKADFDDYDQMELPQVLDDRHVLLEHNYDVDELEYAYLDFPNFYEYLASKIADIVKAQPEESHLLDLLATVKMNLIGKVAEQNQEQLLCWRSNSPSYMGDQHIVKNHAETFAADGIPEEEIATLVTAAIGSRGHLVSCSESAQKSHRTFGVTYRGFQHFITTTVSKTSYIISARPAAYTADNSVREIRLMLDYGCYPAWSYNVNGELVANDLPKVLQQDEVLSGKLAALQEQYDALFIDTKAEFKCNDFESKYDEAVFLDAFYDIQKELEATSEYLITNKITGNYVIKNETFLIRKNEVATVRAASVAKGWYVVTIQGKDIRNVRALFDILHRKFKLPDSGNWPAVADWMTDLSWLGTPGVAVIIEDYPSLRSNRDANDAVIEMFAEDILPFWDCEVITVVVGGERRPFNVYLVE